MAWSGGAVATRMPDYEFRRLVDEARDRHNLSDILRRHTDLKKRGRELIGICPVHQERTPSFQVNDAKGFFHCFGCGWHGDAFTALERLDGMTFKQAFEALTGDTFPVVSDEDRAQRKADDERATEERIALAREIWSRTAPLAGSIGETYKLSRGITIDLPDTVRFVMTPRWRNEETGEVGRDYPAIACAAQAANGDVTAVQCIFLNRDGTGKYERIRDDGEKAKAKLTWGELKGSALRFGPVGPHIVMTEGPEDAWSLMQKLPGQSVWASGGTALMAFVDWPQAVKSVCFAGDNGVEGKNAVDRGMEAAIKRGIIPTEAYPPPDYHDWNDQLRGKKIV